VMNHQQAGAGDTAAATARSDYTHRLVRLESVWWKRVIDVQAPYRWNIRRLRLGHTLDVGCGIGRNLHHLGPGAVGVDHNPDSVTVARARSLTAYTSEEFPSSADGVPASFDTILLAHVVEHMDRESAIAVLTAYLPFLKPGGRVVFITPQEAGYRSDQTHVRFVGFEALADLADATGFAVTRRYSFPFPRMIGKFFRYNEFVAICEPGAGSGRTDNRRRATDQ
jgi:2-polyprenyl-3-methyl-5-hydroxy-6-metoxy-1,4-benzoquinol methylase